MRDGQNKFNRLREDLFKGFLAIGSGRCSGPTRFVVSLKWAIGGSPGMFKVGDNTVYPAHGVAVVKRIEEKLIGGAKKSFYVLQVLENQMTIMVPTDNAGQVGLRGLISDKEVKKVYQILKDREIKVDNTTWNRRYREYMEKIKTGSLFEIAEVLRNLFVLRQTKDLSFGERKMLDQAKQLLVREISLAKKMPETEVDQEIQTIFAS
jgi:CarD family transcriptional regulator